MWSCDRYIYLQYIFILDMTTFSGLTVCVCWETGWGICPLMDALTHLLVLYTYSSAIEYKKPHSNCLLLLLLLLFVCLFVCILSLQGDYTTAVSFEFVAVIQCGSITLQHVALFHFKENHEGKKSLLCVCNIAPFTLSKPFLSKNLDMGWYRSLSFRKNSSVKYK